MSFFFDRWFRFLVGALIFLFFLISVQDVYAFPPLPGEPTYSFSAHGDAEDGVNRTSTDTYSPGNCAHCHEQHASINGDEPDPGGGPSGYALFYTNYVDQTDAFCFKCHDNTNIYAVTAIANYSYSYTFGGNTTADYDSNILSAFSHSVTGSSHYLPDIASEILGVNGLQTASGSAWSSTLNSNLNPCDACHNPHIAQTSSGKPSGAFNADKSAISRPSNHDILWGNDITESMNSYNYQPPYWSGSTTNYEPDNGLVATVSRDNTPDYVTFCTDCHNTNNTISSNNLRIDNPPRALRQIDWTTTGAELGGDKHGKNVATVGVNLDAPYAAAWGSTTGLGLSCTDCHEPHGSPNNVFLIRTSINGAALGGDIGSFDTTNWRHLCARCHVCDTIGDNSDLESIHHLNADAPYNQQSCGGCHGSGGSAPPPMPCNNCHFHGGNDDWLNTVDETPTNRRTF